MRQKHASLFRVVMALALVLSLVVSAVPAQAGQQSWDQDGGAGVDIANISRDNQGVGTGTGIIGPIAVASDGTIFAVTDADADDVTDDVVWSTNAGASFTPFGAGLTSTPSNANPIGAIAVSPNYATDRMVVVAVDALRQVLVSPTAGAVGSWVTSANVWAANDVVNSLDLAPNFTFGTNDTIAVGLDTVGGTQALFTVDMPTLANLAGGWGTPAAIAGAPAAANADNGIWAKFSPNYISDGTILLVISVVASNAGLMTELAGEDANPGVVEGRSINAANWNTAGTLSRITAANSAQAATGPAGASIGFPSGYALNTADNYFVGLNDGDATNFGGIFRRVQGAWQVVPGMALGAATDVTSLAVSGAFSAAHIIAGLRTDGAGVPAPAIQRSTNGGTTFMTAAARLPGTPVVTGGNDVGPPVFVAISPSYSTDNTIYAISNGVGGGFNVSTSGGSTTGAWSQRGLYWDDYDNVTALVASPTFQTDGVALTVQNDGGVGNAVFRSTNGRAGTPAGASATWTKTEGGQVLGAISSISVAPGFTSTGGTAYVANNATQIAKSSNGGQTFTTALQTAIPSGTIIAGRGVVAATSDTVFVLASAGRVQRSTDSGQNWTTYSSNLSNVDQLVVSPAFATDSTVLLSGRTVANAAVVQISTDGGVTWSNLGTHTDTSSATPVVVAFDSDYASTVTATAKFVYSGTDSDVYRWQVGTSTSWSDMNASAYAGAAAPNIPDTIDAAATNIGSYNGILYVTTAAVAAAAGDGVLRAATPKASYDATTATWFNLGWGPRGTPPNIGIAGSSARLNQGILANTTFNVAGAMALSGSSTSTTILLADVFNADDRLQVYDDNLVAAPTLSLPANNAALSNHPGAGGVANAQWSTYSAVPTVRYQIEVSTDSTFNDAVVTGITGVLATVTGSIAAAGNVPAFTAGNTYYWHVRALANAAQDVATPWSETRSYAAAVGTPALLYPTSAPGARLEVPTTVPTFSWTNIANATGYELQIAVEGNTAVYTGYPTSGNGYMSPVITATITTGISYTPPPGTLTEGSVYNWNVRAIFGTTPGTWGFQSGGASGGSGVFKVAGTPPTPTAIPPTATPVPPTAVPGAETPTAVPATAVPATATPAATATPVATAVPATAATQLATMGTNLVMVITYNPSDTADPWKIYDPAAPAFASDLPSLQAGSGYWIYSSAATALTYAGNSYSLSAGWNLVGWLGG